MWQCKINSNMKFCLMSITREPAGMRCTQSRNNCVPDHGKIWCQLIKGVSPYTHQHSMWEKGPRHGSVIEKVGGQCVGNVMCWIKNVHLQYFYKHALWKKGTKCFLKKKKKPASTVSWKTLCYNWRQITWYWHSNRNKT